MKNWNVGLRSRTRTRTIIYDQIVGKPGIWRAGVHSVIRWWLRIESSSGGWAIWTSAVDLADRYQRCSIFTISECSLLI